MSKQAEKDRLIKQLEQVEDYELIKEIQAKLDEALGKVPSYRETLINESLKEHKGKDFFAYAGMWSDRNIDGKELREQAWRRGE